jgi:hypothetical protein
MARYLLGAGMIVRLSVLAFGALAVLATACGDRTEGADDRGANEAAPAIISEGVFHLGEPGGVEPTINVELRSDRTFDWRTDPGRYGDWTPGGSGIWSQAGALITLRPRESDRSMLFSPTLGAALHPTSFVVEANLRVAGSGTLVTASVKEDNGETWSPPSGVDARQVTWERGRACTTVGRSNGCLEGR